MSSDDPLGWTDRQWDELRAVALESARRGRVASTFLPLVGPLPGDQATVPANWLEIPTNDHAAIQPGLADARLEVRSGKTLHLVTIACNLYLRGSEISDPDLDAAKTMVRRAGDVIGRLEDAVVFRGVPKGGTGPLDDTGKPVVQPLIYTVSGGDDLTGLLQVPDTLLHDEVGLKKASRNLERIRDAGRKLARDRKRAAKGKGITRQQIDRRKRAFETALTNGRDEIMSVLVDPSVPANRGPIVVAIVDAIQKLESRGHFGPFAVVLGHELFSNATTPTGSLVLPSDRLAEFLDGRRILRSGVLPPDRGLVVALGGQPIELVLASDIDVKFLQATLQPRYVLRVFERLVLRIKELDAVCGLTTSPELLTPGFAPSASRLVTTTSPDPLSLLERAGRPLPIGDVAARTIPNVVVGTPGTHPADLVRVLLRRGAEPPLAIRALRDAAGSGGPAQWFEAQLPALDPGREAEYRVEWLRAGRRIATLPADGSWFGLLGVPDPPAAAEPPEAPRGEWPAGPRFGYGLEFFATLTADLRAEPIGATPEGYRINFHIEEGRVIGPNIDAVIEPGGCDYMCVRPDGIGVLTIKVTYRTRDGAVILEQAGGVFDTGPDGYAAVAAGRLAGAPPFYATPAWSTAHPAWTWLNRRQGIGVGRVVMATLQAQCDIYLPHVEG